MYDQVDLLKTGVNQSYISYQKGVDYSYNASLLVNDIKSGTKFLSTLLEELDSCDEYSIFVAFVTTGGIAAIINKLHELDKRNIKGRI